MDPQTTTATPSAAATTEANPQVIENAADEAQADADFGAGFNEAQGDTPHAESRPTKDVTDPTKTTSTDGQAAPADTKTKEPTKEAEKAIYGGLTETQLKDALAKAGQVDEWKGEIAKVRDQAFGRMGELQASLKAIQQSAAGGQPQKVAKEQFKKLTEEYPEIAGLIAEDLSEILRAPTVDVASIQKQVDEGITRGVEKRLLASVHRDWQECWRAPDFKEWLGTLRAEVKQDIESSWDGLFLADAVTEYKRWLADGKKAPGTAPNPAAEKEKRLAHATTPSTTGAPAAAGLISDDDAFELGFKGARPQG